MVDARNIEQAEFGGRRRVEGPAHQTLRKELDLRGIEEWKYVVVHIGGDACYEEAAGATGDDACPAAAATRQRQLLGGEHRQ